MGAATATAVAMVTGCLCVDAVLTQRGRSTSAVWNFSECVCLFCVTSRGGDDVSDDDAFDFLVEAFQTVPEAGGRAGLHHGNWDQSALGKRGLCGVDECVTSVEGGLALLVPMVTTVFGSLKLLPQLCNLLELVCASPRC